MADVAKPASGRDTTAYHVRWFRDNADGTFGEEVSAATRYWDTGSLTWVKGTQPVAGGGGGAVTIADGADVAQGTTTDASSANTVVGILKAIKAAITGTVAVSGTFWQATQPVSVAATLTTSEAAPTSITTGKTSTVTAGTRVQLSANTAKSITIRALSTNTGKIYVGNSTVAASNGFQLSAGDTVSLDISNSNVVWIDSSVSAEGVSWLVVN